MAPNRSQIRTVTRHTSIMEIGFQISRTRSMQSLVDQLEVAQKSVAIALYCYVSTRRMHDGTTCSTCVHVKPRWC